ncbi:hypothetical protein P1P68_12210, partial [Streptomyces scabiei]|uniref:biotin/lipoyl-containing protein n=1 Tax=Streptomyces scabiei TaxID=1930 RepID=UPI0029906BE6
MGEFTMPSLGADMDEGTLLEWLVEPGAAVRKGDPVAVVETAKSTIEVECFESGTMTELLVEPGATVPVGTPLAVIGPTGGTSPVTSERQPVRRTRRKTDRTEPAPTPVVAEPAKAARGAPERASTAESGADAGGGAGPGGDTGAGAGTEPETGAGPAARSPAGTGPGHAKGYAAPARAAAFS